MKFGSTFFADTAVDRNVACECHTFARRNLLRGFACLAASAVVANVSFAQAAQESTLDPSLVDDLVAANRILAHLGVLDAYGHVSLRDPKDPNRFWMSRSVAPATVTAADIMQYDLDCNPIDARGRASYYEKWIHGETYKVRPDVNAVIHSHSPTVVPFSATEVPLRPLHQNAAFLSFGVPVFESRTVMPVSDLMIGQQKLGAAMAEKLGPKAVVILLRGHGDVVVAPNLQTAVYRAYFTEVDARLEAQAIALGGDHVTYLSPEEAETADKVVEGAPSVNRCWQLWKNEIVK